jgi:hypothetical protein
MPTYDYLVGGMPSRSVLYDKIREDMIHLEENFAVMGHLVQAEGKNSLGVGWLAMSEAMKVMQFHVNCLQQGRPIDQRKGIIIPKMS